MNLKSTSCILTTLIFIILFNQSFSYIHNPKNFLICNRLNCPHSRGVCTRDNKCVCIGDYTTVNNKELYGDYQCNYLQANQAKAFVLEFLLGFGAGHFYLGNVLLASIKFTFCLFSAILVAVSPCLSANDMKGKCYTYLMGIAGLVWIVWQSIDGVLMGISYYKDKNGIPMSSHWE